MTEHISMDQIRRARAFVDATYYPDGNLPAPRIPEQCPAERPFGPCTKRCVYPAGHDGMHRSQCVVWDDTSWTQFDQTGETVAAVSYAGKIDLAAVDVPSDADNPYARLFAEGGFTVVKPNEEKQP